MTLKLYHEDSYIKSFAADVIDQDHDIHGLVLNQTAFYPGGGGQPADHGWIIFDGNTIPIEQVKTISG
ncbi:MAG: alanine--tRNA ligase-related protein, partial [Anaerolineales bacterium]|nr:alanine--tRNA ligase-related protein [Anaerolineales bacterium]